MFHGAPVMHHFQRATFTLGGNTLQAAAEHTDAVAQERAVGWVVNITFDHGRVGPKFAPPRYPLLARQAHHPLMNLFGDLRTQQREGSTEDRVIGRSLGIEAGEAAVHQVAAQFPFQIAEAPALQVLHDAAAHHTIGSHAAPPGAGRKRAACGQTLAD